MRYAVIHCRNPRCLLKVWVPEAMLGKHGRCPKCGQSVEAPLFVPADELQEGPPILEIEQNGRQLAAASV
jgi:hypothetical protein